MPTTIGLDCRLAGWRHAGIGRYILNLARRLPAAAPEISWIYFVSNQEQEFELFAHQKPQNVTVVLANVRHYSLSEQLSLPKLFSRHHLDLLHVPHFNAPVWYRGKTVITIHDLLWHQQRGGAATTLKGWQYWVKYLGYRVVVNQALNSANIVFVPSKTIQTSLAEHYPQHAQKILVTLEGIDDHLTSQLLPATSLYQRATQNTTLLYVGSLYPHKNIEVVLRALQSLPGYRLLIASARSVFEDRTRELISTLGVENQVEFLGYVPDEQLSELYRDSLALLQPSLSEGFGLTGLEALACGGRVVASDIPIFKEIYQQAALYFNPHEPEQLVASIKQLAKTPGAALRAAAESVVKQYSWDQMTQATLVGYRQALH